MTSKDCAHAGAGPFVSREWYNLFKLLLGIVCSCMVCDGHMIGLHQSNAWSLWIASGFLYIRFYCQIKRQ